ncbi:hypothetical protein [Luxibacter massiliensis]|uniref:hypothetical protein n=1 Tax=Luxibacter massiliensis TaxID=2219695 RepID=UPI000F04EC8B|nr:hypothetical protein [Luxibacter massiliensis]
MKKTKRILALAAAALLICLYGSTLVFALSGSSASLGLLKASMAATILLPVLIYGYTLLFRLAHKDRADKTDTEQ